MAVGRISGPLLKSNLLRQGKDIAFETDLLYIDVNNERLGVKTDSPAHELDISGTARTINLLAGKINVDNIELDASLIKTSVGDLNLEGATEFDKVSIPRVSIPDVQGDVLLSGNFEATGNIHAQGNITADGNITLGDANTDNVSFNADIDSSIIPNATDTYNLGTPTQRWNQGHFNDVFVGGISVETASGGEVSLISDELNKIYVNLNGSDTEGDGKNTASAYRTIKFALSQANSGDTVYISPGEYLEQFPLTVPSGVRVCGESLRSVAIQPSQDTNDQNCFEIQGECHITDLTIKDFFYNSVNDTGYAFVFADNAIIPNRSPYIKDVTVLAKGSITSLSDPFGFAQGDAGRGAFIDGAKVNSTSIEAAMLFDSVTFIVPNSVGIRVTNGARIEYLNSFVYFADIGIDAFTSPEGIHGNGKTFLDLTGIQGTFNAGDVITWFDIDGTTVLANAIIDSTDGNTIIIDGSSPNWEVAGERPGKTVNVVGDAQISTTESNFGASSLELDGANDYLQIDTTSDFGFGTDDFAIETWIYKSAGTGIETIADFRNGQSSDNAVTIGIDNSLFPYVYVNGNFVINSNRAIIPGTWNHIAYTREGTTGTLFVNGINSGSWTDSTDYGVEKPLAIGSVYTGTTSYFTGFIDEFRITNGAARYTSSFSVPQETLRSDYVTVLLLHFEGADGSTNIVDDGIRFQDIRSSSGGFADAISRYDRKDFAAEMRSIASANVYGNRGVRANGPDVILRLSSHDFGYIGSGGDFSNNDDLINTANEVIEINSGKVFYNSTDQFGDYRIGDLFFVDQDTGTVTFNGGQFNVSSLTGINFTDGSNTTIVDPVKIQTGNIQISGNTVETLIGNLNLTSITGTINVDSTVNITGDQTITGDLDVDSQATLRSVNIEDLTSGRVIYAGTNGELEDTSDFTFENKTLSINGDLDVTGDVTVGGNITLGDETTDSLTVDADFTSDLIPNENEVYDLGSSSQTWKNLFIQNVLSTSISTTGIDIAGNKIQTSESNSNLEIDANGTGTVDILTNTNITGSLDTSGQATLNSANIEDLTSGRIVLAGTNGELEDSSNLTFDGSQLTITGNQTVSGVLDVNTSATLASAKIEDLTSGRIVLAGVDGEIEDNANLTFDGSILSVQGSVDVSGDVTIGGDITIGNQTIDSITVAADFTSNLVPNESDRFNIGTPTKSWNNIYGRLLSAQTIQTENIDINGNRIQTTESNSNFEIDANGTGTIELLTNTNVTGTLDVNTSATIASLNIEDLTNGRVVLAGTNGEIEDSNNLTFDGTLLTVTGNQLITGNLDVDGNITLGGNIRIGDQNVDTVEVQADFTSDLLPNSSGSFSLGSPTKKWNTLFAESVSISGVTTDQIEIFDNNIAGTQSNEDIIIRPNGTGRVVIDTDSALKLPVGNDTNRPIPPDDGEIRYNTDSARVENYNGEQWNTMANEDDAVALAIALG